MKQFFGKKSRSALAIVLVVSLGLHLVAILIFGTIKFVTEVLREETVFEAVPITLPPQKEPTYTVNLQQRNRSTPPPRPPAIVVNSPSELEIPALDIDVNVDSSAVYGRGGGGFGGGLAGIREMTITGDLFGATITADKLGIVLDVSQSAHAHLDKAIAEIDKNFAKAPIILVSGCALRNSNDGQNVSDRERILPYNKLDPKLLNQPGAGGSPVPGQMATFFSRFDEKKSKELKEYFTQRGNIFLLYKGDIHASNVAFESLMGMRVDTIYWFADFADQIQTPVIEDLQKKLVDKRIKLIAHNFLGKPVLPIVKEMAKATGGTTIEKIP